MSDTTPAPHRLSSLPAFVFEPTPPQLIGPAFGPVFKVLAWLINAALLVWMLRLQLPWGQGATVWAWAAWAMMGYTAWTVQRSRLHIDRERIEQDWMWRKQIAIADLSYLKLIRVRGLEWLLAPRVYARTMQGSFAVFYCADQVLLAEIERMALELTRWRENIIHGT